MTQQVFISYAKEDEAIADKIYVALKAKEIPCWVAHRDIAAGQNWLGEIIKAISNSRVMIVVLSKHTQRSYFVENEIIEAQKQNLTIIPFCIEKESPTSKLNLLLNNCQWIDAYRHPWDKALEQLIESLQKPLGIELRKPYKKEKKPFEMNILPDFIKDFQSKGWDVKKNDNDSWEAFYKTYDLTMIYIPPGKFMMGSNDGHDHEKPPHEVGLDGYWIGKYEVTFAQYDRYCEATGGKNRMIKAGAEKTSRSLMSPGMRQWFTVNGYPRKPG